MSEITNRLRRAAFDYKGSRFILLEYLNSFFGNMPLPNIPAYYARSVIRKEYTIPDDIANDLLHAIDIWNSDRKNARKLFYTAQDRLEHSRLMERRNISLRHS